jgi:signal transduction histidine kinase
VTLPAHLRLRAERWLDPALAVVLMIGFGLDTATGSYHRRGPLALNLLMVAAMTLPIAWRRRAPLLVACLVMGLGIVMTATLTDIAASNFSLYVMLLPPYTVAAYESRPRALVGLVACLVGSNAVVAIHHSSLSDFVFTDPLLVAAWATGRALRVRRELATELRHKAERITAEREGRERLAVADERTRIARELHAVVATSVSAMVVQTEAAQRLLDDDLGAADHAMASIEETGRDALAEMRRILGILRRGDEGADLAPQPGVGQIHALVERVRRSERSVALTVAGEPGPLPASVDLCLYRVLEGALEHIVEHGEVSLRFGENDVELLVAGDFATEQEVPNLAMRERVALCEGRLDLEPVDDRRQRLRVQLPRVFEGVYA